VEQRACEVLLNYKEKFYEDRRRQCLLLLEESGESRVNCEAEELKELSSSTSEKTT